MKTVWAMDLVHITEKHFEGKFRADSPQHASSVDEGGGHETLSLSAMVDLLETHRLSEICKGDPLNMDCEGYIELLREHSAGRSLNSMRRKIAEKIFQKKVEEEWTTIAELLEAQTSPFAVRTMDLSLETQVLGRSPPNE
jgi:hypothetical protein